MDTLMPIFSLIAEHGEVWFVIAILMLFSKKTRPWAFAVVIAMAATWLLGEWVIKPFVARPRPFMADPSFTLLIAAPSGYSFPSMHTAVAFAAATAMAYSPMKKIWKVLGYVLAAVIAFSRLYLFVHYPTDVLAGLVLGIVIAIIVGSIFKAVQKAKRKRTMEVPKDAQFAAQQTGSIRPFQDEALGAYSAGFPQGNQYQTGSMYPNAMGYQTRTGAQPPVQADMTTPLDPRTMQQAAQQGQRPDQQASYPAAGYTQPLGQQQTAYNPNRSGNTTPMTKTKPKNGRHAR